MVPGIITTVAGMVTVERGTKKRWPSAQPSSPIVSVPKKQARKNSTPASSSTRRSTLATVPSEAASSAIRFEALNKMAKPPTLRKLAMAAAA